MSEKKHTSEPWVVIDKEPHHGVYIEDEHGKTVCDFYFIAAFDDVINQENAEANAARIVACINACAGIPNENLLAEDNIVTFSRKMLIQRDELLQALKDLLFFDSNSCPDKNFEARSKAQLLIADIEREG